jgi:uncharacterized membrane protein
VTTRRGIASFAAERQIGRLLILFTSVSVTLLVVGVLLLLAAGISPLDGGPPLDLSTLLSEVVALGPAGFLWLGLVAVIVTPVSRVVLAAITFGRAGDWSMVWIAFAILAVIATGVATAAAGTV